MVVEIETIDEAKDIIDISNCIHFYVTDEVIEFSYLGNEVNMQITMDDSDDAIKVHGLIMAEIKKQISKGGFKCSAYLKIYKDIDDKYASMLSF